MEDSNARLPLNYLSNIDSARQYKELGNERYKNGEYGAALGQYHRAIIYLKAIDASQKSPFGGRLGKASADNPLPADRKREVDQLYADCQSNLAACLLQSEKPSYNRVVDCCNEAIARVPNNVKAHYRLGVALYHQKRYADAVDALQKAAKLQAKPDANVTKYLALCRKEMTDEKQRERDRWKAMFPSAD